MGFFGSSSKLLVASTVYNMAGDIAERSDYLKTAVVGNIVSNTKFSIAETLSSSYLKGPGIRMRSFARWAELHGYESAVGIAYSDLSTVARLNNVAVGEQIPSPPGYKKDMQTVELAYGDFSYWADQYVMVNRPDMRNGTWTSDFNDETNVITITYPDNTTDSFTPSGYSQLERYIYATYNLVPPDSLRPYQEGSEVIFPEDDPFPSVIGWKEEFYTPTSEVVNLNTKVDTYTTYSDGRPAESTSTTTPVPTTIYGFHALYSRPEYKGILPGQENVTTRMHYMYQDRVPGDIWQLVNSSTETVDIGGGVTKTTVTTITQDEQHYVNSYQEDYQDRWLSLVGPLEVFIYRYGSGNPVLDAMFNTVPSGDKFYPFIPMKLKEWVGDPLYTITKKAFKKSTGGDLDEVKQKLLDNDDIDDIDFIYGVFGASLNSPENSAKEYIFRFFEMLHEAYPPNPTFPTLTEWKANWSVAHSREVAWADWYNAQKDFENPLYGADEPPRGTYPVMPKRSIRVWSSSGMEYDMEILWSMIEFSIGSGQVFPGAKPGDVRILDGGKETYPIQSFYYDDSGMAHPFSDEQSIEKLVLQWQDSTNTWRSMNLYGAKHKNRVYEGKSVDISGRDALADAEESGFIIPLHQDTFRSMSLVRATQMATASNYLVLNSYQRVKKKWYQTGLFQVVVIIVIIVITIFFPPAGGAGAGVLGTNVAVGTALGFVGLAAIVVGAIANALAAMILVSIIQKVSTVLFGDKLGAIIGTIASLIAIQVGTAMQTGTTMSAMMGQMMRADNLLRLTSTLGSAVSQYINAGTMELMQKTEQMMQSYNAEMTDLQRQYEKEFGYNNGTINPIGLTDAFALASESRDSFLSRTLMTGSDVADMSLMMIDNFAEMNLKLDK